MGSLHDACFSMACKMSLYKPHAKQLHLWSALLALCMLRVSRAAAHYNELCHAPKSLHTTTAAADCGMAKFEDPQLCEKIDTNLGPEACAAAKNMKFLNFHVSLFWLGLGVMMGIAGYQVTHRPDASASTVQPSRAAA